MQAHSSTHPMLCKQKVPVKKLLTKVLWLWPLTLDSWDSPVGSRALFLSACFSNFGVCVFAFVIPGYLILVVKLKLKLCSRARL